MSFFTGKGDEGTTKLFDSQPGVRQSKSQPIFECLGQLDELNGIIGWCKVACEDFLVFETPAREVLLDVQNHLFTMQAEVAGADKQIPLEDTDTISTLIQRIESSLPPVTSFLIAGGTELSARLDIARSVSRRVERRIVLLNESGDRAVSAGSRAYINRLSSLLYALTRLENHASGVAEKAPEYQG
jgi:cob(I)alamin adenosyltransferase